MVETLLTNLLGRTLWTNFLEQTFLGQIVSEIEGSLKREIKFVKTHWSLN